RQRWGKNSMKCGWLAALEEPRAAPSPYVSSDAGHAGRRAATRRRELGLRGEVRRLPRAHGARRWKNGHVESQRARSVGTIPANRRSDGEPDDRRGGARWRDRRSRRARRPALSTSSAGQTRADVSLRCPLARWNRSAPAALRGAASPAGEIAPSSAGTGAPRRAARGTGEDRAEARRRRRLRRDRGQEADVLLRAAAIEGVAQDQGGQ